MLPGLHVMVSPAGSMAARPAIAKFDIIDGAAFGIPPGGAPGAKDLAGFKDYAAVCRYAKAPFRQITLPGWSFADGFVILAPSLAQGFVLVRLEKVGEMLAGLNSLGIGTAYQFGATLPDTLGYAEVLYQGLEYVTLLGPKPMGWSRIMDVTPMMKPWS